LGRFPFFKGMNRRSSRRRYRNMPDYRPFKGDAILNKHGRKSVKRIIGILAYL